MYKSYFFTTLSCLLFLLGQSKNLAPKVGNAVPQIVSFSPTTAGQGDVVAITGNSFLGATAVSFGGSPAVSFTVVDDNNITAVLDNGSSGSVVVTTAGGTASLAGFTYDNPPVITSFSPTTSFATGIVTITGMFFHDVVGVSFGGTSASTFTVVNTTTITAIVALGSASGDLSVTTLDGTATQPGFTYVAPPQISTFLPTSAVSGTLVTIRGNFFTGATGVSFGGTQASSFTIVGDNTINAVVASGSTGNVSVSNLAGTTSLAGFRFLNPPTISSFTPDANYYTNGTEIITGTNFTGATAVSFGGTAANSFTVVNSTTITAVVNSGSASGNVSVTTPDGIATLGGFVFVTHPKVNSFSPTTAGFGTTVSISGNFFTGATGVFFGGTAAASFTIIDDNNISAVLANGSSGSVSVAGIGGERSLAGFIYSNPPTITSFTPTSSASNGTVTITGTYFTGATAVSFGGVAAPSFTVVNSTTITAVVAMGSASGDVDVTTPDGTANLAGFNFIAPPNISSFSPTSAFQGNTVTILGNYFSTATGVKFGNTNAASITIVSDNTITAVVANGSTGNVEVVGAGGTFSLAGFTYLGLANNNWTGLASTAWNNPANWTNNVVPTSTSVVTIPSTASNQPNLNVNVVIAGAILNGNITLNGKNLTITGPISGSGDFKGDPIASMALSGSTGALNFDPTSNSLSTLTVNGTVSLGNSLDLYKELDVTSGTLTTNGNLTLKSTSISNTAVVGQVGGTIIGNVTVERFIPQNLRVYRDLGTNVSNAGFIYNNWQESGNTTNGYGIQITGTMGTALGTDPTTGLDYTPTGNHSMFTYVNSIWDTVLNTKTTQLAPFQGYRVLVRGNRTVNVFQSPQPLAMLSPATLRSTGALITGKVSFLTNGIFNGNGNQLSSYHLAPNPSDFSFVSNPYVCPIDWNTISTNSTALMNSYWYADPTFLANDGLMTYVTYNQTAGTVSNPLGSNVNNYIQPGQAFFVQNDATASAHNLLIQETDKAATSTKTATFSTPVIPNRIALGLNNANGNIDGTVAVFNPAFSKSIGKEDATKFTNGGENISIFYNNKNLCIYGQPLPTMQDTLPIHLYGLKPNTNYTLRFDASQFVGNGIAAFVNDNGKPTILVGNTTALSFTTTGTTPAALANRYSIVFAPIALPITSINLTTKANNNNVALAWTVVGSDAAAYTIERNTPNGFVTLTTVEALTLNYVDAKPLEGTNSYRIKATSKNGNIVYSTIAQVNFASNATSKLSISPNPVIGNNVHLKMEGAAAGSYTIRITNASGKLVQTTRLEHGNSVYESLNINILSAGTYTLQAIGTNTTTLQTHFEIIN